MDENKEKENTEEALVTQKELEKCAKERDEYLEGWKRAKADLSNYKKDEQKRFEELLMFGHNEIVRELVLVLDSFDIALSSRRGVEDKQTDKGMYLIRAKLEGALKKYGLEQITVRPGDQFDPSVHEALLTEDVGNSSGTVIEEIEKGYRMHGRVIRPARVKVAK